MIVLVLVATVILVDSAVAGIKWVDVGVNGLTCSVCTRSIEMSVSRLEFVDSVVMDLEQAEGRVYLNERSPISLNKIADAVVGAGFSVRFIKAVFTFDGTEVDDNGFFEHQGQLYQWLEFKEPIKGEVSLKLVDADFLPRKESTKWKKKIELSDKQSDKKIIHVVREI